MTIAAELLTELKDSGVQLSLADGELELQPFSKVTQQQVVLLEENGQVIEQLVELQEWQNAIEEDTEDFLNDGGGSEHFGEYFDQWYAREELLRNVLGYEGCIHGSGKSCPDFVVRCESCTPKQKKRRYKSL